MAMAESPKTAISEDFTLLEESKCQRHVKDSHFASTVRRYRGKQRASIKTAKIGFTCSIPNHSAEIALSPERHTFVTAHFAFVELRHLTI